jgi:hypothetical protein
VRLKRQFLELLEKDLEFRRAVVGMLELEKIIEGLKKHDEKFEKILEKLEGHKTELVRFREDFNKLGEEMTKLREDMILGFKRHDEVLEKHVQEIAKLREDFNKMLSVSVQIQEEQRKLRESYERLEKYVESLEESQIRLEKHMVFLEKDLKSLEGAMLRGFADMSKFAGTTFEEFVRGFLTEALRRSGEIPEGAELKKTMIDGEEINIFLENPLIVGEVTASAESVSEIMKLLKKAELVKARYSREPKKILIVLTARKDVIKEIEKIAKERDVKLVIGKIVG